MSVDNQITATAATRSMIQAACKAISDRGKGNSVTVLDITCMLNAALCAVHPDDMAVDRFAFAMKAKLARKRAEGRGGWDDPEQCHIDYLHQLLSEQFHERSVIDPVDIANLAMMIHERTPSNG